MGSIFSNPPIKKTVIIQQSIQKQEDKTFDFDYYLRKENRKLVEENKKLNNDLKQANEKAKENENNLLETKEKLGRHYKLIKEKDIALNQDYHIISQLRNKIREIVEQDKRNEREKKKIGTRKKTNRRFK